MACIIFPARFLYNWIQFKLPSADGLDATVIGVLYVILVAVVSFVYALFLWQKRVSFYWLKKATQVKHRAAFKTKGRDLPPHNWEQESGTKGAFRPAAFASTPSYQLLWDLWLRLSSSSTSV